MRKKAMDEEQKDTQTTFRPFRSPETDPKSNNVNTFDSVTKKDLFLMTFFAFITGGILILGILFFSGAITGNVVFDFPGEKEVVVEETAALVIDNPENLSSEGNVTEIVFDEPVTVEEEVEEVVEEEVSDPCGSENEIILALDDPYTHNGRTVELTLAGDFSAQISVGGMKELISVGETMDINGLDITMLDGNEADASVTISIGC